MSDSPENTPALPSSTNNPIQNVNPVSDPGSQGIQTKNLVGESDLDIKSKSNQKTISDSTRVLEEKKNKPPIKYVDQKQ
jgi:hypothetical protein